MKPNALPPVELVKSRLNYDPSTGIFTWASKKNGLSRIKVGDPAGRVTSFGYLTIKIDGVSYFAHRLAWLIMTGEDPEVTVDHANRDRLDNKWENLRLATKKQQSQNRNIKGCTQTRYGKWRAMIKINQRSYHIGTFETQETASVVYWLVAKFFFGDFACSIAQEFWSQLDETQQSELKKAAEAAQVKIQNLIPEDQEKNVAVTVAAAA